MKAYDLGAFIWFVFIVIVAILDVICHIIKRIKQKQGANRWKKQSLKN